MAGIGIKIKVSWDRLEAFAKQCTNVIDQYYPEDDHEKLLFEHLVEMRDMVQKKLLCNQANYTLNLGGSMALAMLQLWQRVPLGHDPYSKVFIDEVIQKVDKQSKSPTAKYRRGNG